MNAVNGRRVIQRDAAVVPAIASRVFFDPRTLDEATRFRLPIECTENFPGYALAR